MDGDRVVKRASARAADGGYRDRSLSQLSGGQWRRASLALELAFAELARQRSRFSCNLLVLDEVLSQLDSYGRARVSSGDLKIGDGCGGVNDCDGDHEGGALCTIIVIQSIIRLKDDVFGVFVFFLVQQTRFFAKVRHLPPKAFGNNFRTSQLTAHGVKYITLIVAI